MDYLIQNDYQQFKNELLKLPHIQKTYMANDEVSLTNKTYFIVTGRVIELLLLEDGREHALVAYGPKTLFPPLFSASMKSRDTLLFRVIQPSTLWCYDSALLSNYAQTQPALRQQLNQTYLNHMDYYLNDISQLITESGMQRLVSFLTYYLKEHRPTGNLIPIRQKNIAVLIAVNPTNMSRNIKKLKDANLITISGNGINVLDPQALEKYLT
ncbi:Crp/Fnr family transcriptional regulator [Levilactobacillus yiduensis]|uniref:Crp/Fnr family transcriptional regulator n=1 Tax=Levilactobacillus yiduensis TaxID=2953880 RepID=UPI000EF2AE4D|nr:Crp/Fnr family transcriptional regulator [Levilactobacillus yiduensis]AYM01503.1 Crp/Fnr family transcriptional regulator [Levilactobacillus brevis]